MSDDDTKSWHGRTVHLTADQATPPGQSLRRAGLNHGLSHQGPLPAAVNLIFGWDAEIKTRASSHTSFSCVLHALATSPT